MSEITLDADLKTKLNGLNEQIIIRDEAGTPIGIYLPMEDYKTFLRNVEIPFSNEEMEQRRQEKGGSSLQDFWKTMGR